jgi:hypothetical protein
MTIDANGNVTPTVSACDRGRGATRRRCHGDQGASARPGVVQQW